MSRRPSPRSGRSRLTSKRPVILPATPRPTSAPAIAGKIVEVNFDIGSYVQKGSVLVRLDARDAMNRLDQARAQLAQQEQAVQQAEAGVQQAIANLSQTQARLGVPQGSRFNVENSPV